MRLIRSAPRLPVALLAAALCAGAASPAAAQSSFDGKTVDELLDLVRKTIESREGGARSGQDYGRFHGQKQREFGQRAGAAAATWDKEPGSRRSKLGKALLDARVRRAFGDFNQCNKVLQAAYRKAQNPLQKQLAAIELAKMFQLRGDRKEALTWIGISQREVKDPKARGWLKEEGAKVAKMGVRLKQYKELLEEREANPRDPAVQLKLCEHLRNFADAGPRFLQGGNTRDLPFLLVELYVNYEWMRTAFPSHPTVVAGGIDSFMLDQAIAARDHVTAAEVATRLLRNEQNGRATSGQLMQDMAVALERDESRRGQALLCWRALAARYPNYPSVKGGNAKRRVDELSKESKLRAFAKAEIPPIPWK